MPSTVPVRSCGSRARPSASSARNGRASAQLRAVSRSSSSKIVFGFLDWLSKETAQTQQAASNGEETRRTFLQRTPTDICFAGLSSSSPSIDLLRPPTRAAEPNTQQAAAAAAASQFSWAGSGLYFFWQLGAMKYLSEQYDLTAVPMTGASGGSLAAVLGACGVPADRVLQRAYELSLEYDIWERPMGLAGVWGRLDTSSVRPLVRR